VISLTRFRQKSTNSVYYPKSALALLLLLNRLRYDIIHLHIGGNFSLRLLGLGLVCSLLPKAKSVLTFHSGGYPSTGAGRQATPSTLRGFVLRRLDRLIAVNQELVELFKRFGCNPSRISLISPYAVGIPPSVQASSGGGFPPALQQFFETHDPVLVTVGLLEPEYDLKLQIDGLERIREDYPNAGLVIIGAGSIEDDLRTRIASTSYPAHVLLCGDVPHHSTLQAIARSDAFLRTTLYDGDSISIREALHLRTPVIATDNGMRPHGVHLIPASDLVALRSTVSDVLENRPEARTAPTEIGSANLAAIFRLYEELLAAKETPGATSAD
jgi:glycosyltransferase involved in cell wall biosynthesis